jgi:hypothetical protein
MEAGLIAREVCSVFLLRQLGHTKGGGRGGQRYYPGPAAGELKHRSQILRKAAEQHISKC